MTRPFDAVTAIHNAFRADIARIDAAALEAAHGAPGLDAALDRFSFLEEVLEWHAAGEEAAVFTALEDVAPRVAWAYHQDHRALDAGFAEFVRSMSTRDPVQTARATAAYKFHLDVHLGKEDAQVYPLLTESLPLPDQGAVLGALSSTVPRDRFPEVVAWMFPLIDLEDRTAMTRIWQQVMPPELFAGVVGMIRAALGPDFAALDAAVPDLPAA